MPKNTMAEVTTLKVNHWSIKTSSLAWIPRTHIRAITTSICRLSISKSDVCLRQNRKLAGKLALCSAKDTLPHKCGR